ncbi:NAD+ synthase [Basilea psittacipulmonis]|uniref:Glutamine-dependent NAD(+) synthetase n=1 Tax=Basilea psittacipulmonis DSM 24701 TaxID=1072685 RepID=A0A077DDY6_9BURK|nr:NAD+ synthase [Basilea psittacipulmonis]AIL32844.1 hypothetical protein IX83_05510 [Basilea psittacipulmonis DSM 24701]
MNTKDKDSLIISYAQLNATVGDFKKNKKRILDAVHQASNRHAKVLLLPELMLSGYPTEDLMLRTDFIKNQSLALNELKTALTQYPDIYVILGLIDFDESRQCYYNTAVCIKNGELVATYYKHELPNYAVFDEKRYFTPGQTPCVLEIDGHKFGIAICEDIWFEHIAQTYEKLGVETILSLNASPFTYSKVSERLAVIQKNIVSRGLNCVYVNMVGGQDELVFDGSSMVVNADGVIADELPDCQESIGFVSLNGTKWSAKTCIPLEQEPVLAHDKSIEARIWRCLCMATRDYVHKTGFKDIVLGLSGGIDSAVVLAIAHDALGSEHCRAVMMPSRYTADISLLDAAKMAKDLNVTYHEIEIAPMMQSFASALSPIFAGLKEDTTEENLQARIRGNLLMALSNKFGSLVLTTGNKSELATGYCTLYGDMVGAYAVIKDVYKTLVYDLAKWRNQHSPVIPERIITRPPSAELRDNQVDQDSLPEYDVLDAILRYMVEKNESSSEIIARGFKQEEVLKVARLLKINEYKRRQGAIGPKITSRAFGRDWRYPIAQSYYF